MSVTPKFSSSAVNALTIRSAGLDEVVVEADVPPELGVRLRGAVGHLDDEAARAVGVGAAQHEGDTRPGRCSVARLRLRRGIEVSDTIGVRHQFG